MAWRLLKNFLKFLLFKNNYLFKDMNKYLWNTFKKTCFNRNFELAVFEYVKKKKINLPTYLSAGQETITASLSEICKKKNIKTFNYLDNIDAIHYIFLLVGLDKLNSLNYLVVKRLYIWNGRFCFNSF